MITWIDESQFLLAIPDPVLFDQNLQTISGIELAGLSQKLSSINPEPLEEFLYPAWRCYGKVQNQLFYLDAVQTSTKTTDPLKFHLITTCEKEDNTGGIKVLLPVLQFLGDVRITHVSSRGETGRYSLLRVRRESHTAEIIFRTEKLSEVAALRDILLQGLNDTSALEVFESVL